MPGNGLIGQYGLITGGDTIRQLIRYVRSYSSFLLREHHTKSIAERSYHLPCGQAFLL
jgi:hypothetical protein